MGGAATTVLQHCFNLPFACFSPVLLKNGQLKNGQLVKVDQLSRATYP
jgi:hypothetical protein